jgi:hemerythrin-like metal-binding protein
MSLIRWTDALSVGIPSIDNQHEQLVSQLNQLQDGMFAGKEKSALGGILQGLIEHTIAHFKYEEELFARTDYPDAIAHKEEHDKLVQDILDVRKKYETVGASVLTIPLMNFLKNWLTAHIKDADMKCSAHLIAKGIR